MDIREIPDQGLVIDGHVPRADAVASARTHMLAAGMDEIAVDDLLVDRPHLIGRAWWSDRHGFIQEHHDDGGAVTVIHVSVQAAVTP